MEVVDHRRPESDLMKGDRLTFSVADSCNKCESCLKGLEQKCTRLFKVYSKVFDMNSKFISNLISMVMQN